jgi:hypothetical protein
MELLSMHKVAHMTAEDLEAEHPRITVCRCVLNFYRVFSERMGTKHSSCDRRQCVEAAPSGLLYTAGQKRMYSGGTPLEVESAVRKARTQLSECRVKLLPCSHSLVG